MSWNAERLWQLIPAVHRVRDATEGGGALRALVEVLARQSTVLEESLEQLYDDQFVETAAPWVLPYIGDLLRIEGLPPAPLASRAEVANTLAWRRRKGTAHVLERIARDVTGLDARAVEFFELLAATQWMNHLRPANQAWVSVRGATRLEQLDTPFERGDGAPDITHTVDVRRIRRRRGRYNIPNVGIFLWRLRAYRLTASPAVPIRPADVEPWPGPAPANPAKEVVAPGFASAETQCYRVHPLGCDAPLYHAPVTEDDPAGLAGPLNVPAPISRRRMRERPRDYYGETPPSGPVARSVLVERALGGGVFKGVEPAEVEVCDLRVWRRPPAGKVMSIDPVLGRIAFRDPQADGAPRVTWHYGFAADLGGGEYGRGWPQRAGGPEVRVRMDGAGGASTSIGAGLAALIAAIDADPAGRRAGLLTIDDGGRYVETLAPVALGDRQVTVRARDGRRPTVLLQQDLVFSGDRDGAVALDGLLVAGAAVRVTDPGGGEGLGRITIRHCTLVPGRTLALDGEPVHPAAVSLSVEAAGTELRVERSVVGAVRAVLDARVRIADSVLDATAADRLAYGGAAPADWGAPLRLENVTVMGRVRADALELVSNTLLLADAAGGFRPVEARRTQEGCIRFSYVPPGARTPRRFQCRPAAGEEDARVRPAPLSTRLADPAYVLLPAHASAAVRRGADDEGEMGALHLNHLPRREAHLRTRLEEYLRFGLEAGVFFIP
jgi:hypothetical protein